VIATAFSDYQGNVVVIRVVQLVIASPFSDYQSSAVITSCPALIHSILMPSVHRSVELRRSLWKVLILSLAWSYQENVFVTSIDDMFCILVVLLIFLFNGLKIDCIYFSGKLCRTHQTLILMCIIIRTEICPLYSMACNVVISDNNVY